MLLMKACPRCSGDLIRTRDPYEDETVFSCVQCGYVSYAAVAALPARAKPAATTSRVTRLPAPEERTPTAAA